MSQNVLFSGISASADGGPRSRVRARGTLRSAPHRHLRKFSGTHFCRVTFKHLPQPLRSHNRSFRTLRQVVQDIYEISQFLGKIGLIGGGGEEVSDLFSSPVGIFLFMLLGSTCKNSGPYVKSSWDIFEISPFSGQNRVN